MNNSQVPPCSDWLSKSKVQIQCSSYSLKIRQRVLMCISYYSWNPINIHTFPHRFPGSILIALVLTDRLVQCMFHNIHCALGERNLHEVKFHLDDLDVLWVVLYGQWPQTLTNGSDVKYLLQCLSWLACSFLGFPAPRFITSLSVFYVLVYFQCWGGGVGHRGSQGHR